MKRKILTFLIPIVLLFFIASLLPAKRLSAYNGAKTDYIKVYRNHCQKCHGSDGKGTRRGKVLGSPDFTNPEWQDNISNVEIIEAITNGKNKMPSWKGRLDPKKIMAVGRYLRFFVQKKRR